VQTNWVASRLREAHPGLEISVVVIQTSGDRTQAANVPLSSFGEKGIFAKELETALLAGEIDLAVHSMKDLAATLPDGLVIASVPVREDVRDVVVGTTLAALPPGARVGTGSVRRRALLAEMRPDLAVAEIRGNVDTRIRKLREGQYDAILLAAAGLNRLGRSTEIEEHLDPEIFIPDPGQGALAIETRVDNATARALVTALSDPAAEAATRAERAFLAALGGGCQTPVGAWATVSGTQITLRAMTVVDGLVRRATAGGDVTDPIAVGDEAAARLQAPPA
jgi:hydroxymethylbilane synthase